MLLERVVATLHCCCLFRTVEHARSHFAVNPSTIIISAIDMDVAILCLEDIDIVRLARETVVAYVS